MTACFLFPLFCVINCVLTPASRFAVESTGAPGRVQVSATTAKLLMESGVHALEYRGKVSAKGKGELDTYWLLCRSAGAPYRASLPDRRSSAFLAGRRASAMSMSSARSSAVSTVSSAMDTLVGITVMEGSSHRSEGGSFRGEGSYRGGGAEGGRSQSGSARRAHTAPAGSTQAAEDEAPL